MFTPAIGDEEKMEKSPLDIKRDCLSAGSAKGPSSIATTAGTKIVKGSCGPQANSALSMTLCAPRLSQRAHRLSSRLLSMAKSNVYGDDVKSRYNRDVRICRQIFYSAEPAMHPIAVAAFAHWFCLRSALMAQEPLLPGSAYSWLFPQMG